MPRFEKKLYSDEHNATIQALRDLRKIEDTGSQEYRQQLMAFKETIKTLLNKVEHDINGINEIRQMNKNKPVDLGQGITMYTDGNKKPQIHCGMNLYDDPNGMPGWEI